jgi:DNA-binding Xre family transcriptional regulator
LKIESVVKSVSQLILSIKKILLFIVGFTLVGYKKICNYIANEWISTSMSNRSFAIDHNIDEKTVRKILSEDGSEIPIITLIRICEAKEIKLSDFFKLIEL